MNSHEMSVSRWPSQAGKEIWSHQHVELSKALCLLSDYQGHAVGAGLTGAIPVCATQAALSKGSTIDVRLCCQHFKILINKRPCVLILHWALEIV